MAEHPERRGYKVYAICYRVNDEETVADLSAAIRESPGWAKYFDSTWFVATLESIDDLYKRLRAKTGNADYLLIIRVDEKDKIGWLPKKAWEWFRSIVESNAGEG